VKYIQSSYNGSHDELIIAPIGDIHIGSPHFDRKSLQKHLDWIREHKENTRIILMGDILETALKDSIGAGWAEQEQTLMEHLYIAKNYFYEFRDIIDGIIEGNHELRVYQRSGLLLMKILAEMLNIPDRYMKYQGIIKYAWNRRAYNVSVWHGTGGGRKTGSSVNRAESQTDTVLCDVYLIGHTHRQHVHNRVMYVPDARNNKLTMMVQYFVNTGHALDHEGSYAEAAGLPPGKKGFPLIYLGGKSIKDGNITIRSKDIRVVI
jgi:predicted phosphodiesterase